jgi:hypothetical protein
MLTIAHGVDLIAKPYAARIQTYHLIAGVRARERGALWGRRQVVGQRPTPFNTRQ